MIKHAIVEELHHQNIILHTVCVLRQREITVHRIKLNFLDVQPNKSRLIVSLFFPLNIFPLFFFLSLKLNDMEINLNKHGMYYLLP